MRQLKLSEIRIYPVKSLGGVRVTKSRVMEKGLEWDRRFMLVDDENRFISQRTLPVLSLFTVHLDASGIVVTFRGDTITIPITINEGSIKSAVIWDDQVNVFPAGSRYDEWFSEHTQADCRLMYFPESNARAVDPNFQIANEHVSLADGFPFLLIGESSLHDLNGRLEEPVPMSRFRPNLVITGADPYEEDRWKEFSIGRSRFMAVKQCSRCITTTVDHSTGTHGKEPLKTLNTYRMQQGKVYFGQNLIALDHFEIMEGDAVTLHPETQNFASLQQNPEH